jgi:diguanylate cyclase (GGDEF)-like protein/PAS domain S-box-containing protein
MIQGHVRVLLIEDDEDDYLLTRDLLKAALGDRHTLDWIPDFDGALAALRWGAHDVCLVDYRLGAQSGLELMRRALAAGCSAPFIVLTGQGAREIDIEAMASGAADYLDKGIQRPDSLERAIRYAITRRAAETALRKSEQQQRIILSNIDEAVYLIAREAGGGWPPGVNFVSDALQRLIGYEPQELLRDAQFLFSIAHAADLQAMHQTIATRFSAKAGATLQYRVTHKLTGQVLWIEEKILPQLSDMGEISSLIGILRDVTQSKAEQDKLIHAAFHDRLTGLPNRTLFMDRLANVMRRDKQSEGGHWAVLFLDLDHFKAINDTLGHEAGDQVLITTAQRIRDCLRAGDILARMGGDEFVILLDDMASADDAHGVRARIHKELAKPHSIKGCEICCVASIGIAAGARGYEQPEDVVRDADAAMYHAKSESRAGTKTDAAKEIRDAERRARKQAPHPRPALVTVKRRGRLAAE